MSPSTARNVCRRRLIGDDHWTDLAIIQMDMDMVRKQNIQFSSAQLGDSSSLVVGQDVMAFGTPFGLARTVTRGSVSNTDRTFFDAGSGWTSMGMRLGIFRIGFRWMCRSIRATAAGRWWI